MTNKVDSDQLLNLNMQAFVQQTREIDPMLKQCWFNIEDGGPTSLQYRLNILCLLGV